MHANIEQNYESISRQDSSNLEEYFSKNDIKTSPYKRKSSNRSFIIINTVAIEDNSDNHKLYVKIFICCLSIFIFFFLIFLRGNILLKSFANIQ